VDRRLLTQTQAIGDDPEGKLLLADSMTQAMKIDDDHY